MDTRYSPDSIDRWDYQEREIFDSVANGHIGANEDSHLQELFDETLFAGKSGEEWEQLYDELSLYLWDEYGVTLALDLDWEAYREWYDSH